MEVSVEREGENILMDLTKYRRIVLYSNIQRPSTQNDGMLLRKLAISNILSDNEPSIWIYYKSPHISLQGLWENKWMKVRCSHPLSSPHSFNSPFFLFSIFFILWARSTKCPSAELNNIFYLNQFYFIAVVWQSEDNSKPTKIQLLY